MTTKRYVPAHSRAAVDEVLPPGPLFALGLQHVLVMYAGSVLVPLIIGSAAGLTSAQITFLISADLFVTGIVTLIQSAGLWGFGVKLPLIMSVSFTPLGPMLAIAADPEMGLLGIYGATFAAGVFGLVCAPIMGRLLRFFPPVVIGTELIMVGLAIMGVSADWAAGGHGSPGYGSLGYIGTAALVAAAALLLIRYARGFIQHIAVLLAIVLGFVCAIGMGEVNFAPIAEARWFGVVTPLHFGLPTFHFWAVLAMCMIMIATFIESTGMFYAVADMAGKKLTRREIVRGFRADASGYLLGATFNTFPYTSFAENVGLVSMSGVKSRWVTVASGVILIALGLCPKLSAIVSTVPKFVLGGATLIMFGLIASTGIKMLAAADFKNNRGNEYVVAVSIAIGMLPVVAPDFFNQFPEQMAPFLKSGILLSAIAAIFLNLFFNGIPRRDAEPEPEPEDARPAQGSLAAD